MTASPAPRPWPLARVLPGGLDAIAAAQALAAVADERHVLCQLLALGTREVQAHPGDRVALRVIVSRDVFERLADATEVDMPDPYRPATSTR
jgi:hypothetical protein